jgi:hypothetical protein
MLNKISKLNWHKIFFIAAIFALIINLLVSFGNIFWNNILNYYFPIKISITLCTFFLILILLLILKNKIKLERLLIPSISWAFLISLIIISLSFFDFSYINNFVYLENFIVFIKKHSYYLMLALFLFGFLTFYLLRHEILSPEDEEKNKELSIEQKRLTLFSEKFFKIGRLPVIGHILKYIYKEGIFYFAILVAIIMGGIYLRLKDVSSLFFWVDEANTMMVAQRIAEGKGQTWISGVFYQRGIIYHHYVALLIKYVSSNLYYIGRAANTPFFVIIIFTIYYFSKTIFNKKIGIIASIFFTFSWVSISIFRNARFYEMWLSVILILIFLLYQLIQRYLDYTEKKIYPFIKKNVLLLILILCFGAISYDCQELTALILYPLITFGVLIFLFKNRGKGLFIFSSSFVLLFIGLIYKYKFSAPFHFLSQKLPEFKALYPDTPILGLWIFLLNNQYNYLIVIFTLTIIILIIFRKNLAILFLSSIIFSWYFIVAFQGYDTSMIRYYYPIFPLLAIQISVCSMITLKLFKNNKIQQFIIGSLLIILIIFSLYSGIQESNSILSNSSKNYFNNDNFGKGLLFLKANVDIERSTVITNNIWSLPYFLYFNKTPNYIIFDDKIIKFDENKVDPMTNQPEVNYQEVLKIERPFYIIFNYPSQRTSQDSFNLINSVGNQLFRDGNIRVYIVK